MIVFYINHWKAVLVIIEQSLNWPIIREAILALSIEDLLEKLNTDQLQPLEVLQAYQAKALSVNKVVTK